MKIRRTEGVLLAIGLVLMAAWAGVWLYGFISSRAAITQFKARAANLTDKASASLSLPSDSPVDFRLWSPQRISAYEESLAQKKDAPLAILYIRKIKLEVPIFNGTDDLALNRGVGRILGTARIGHKGNLGIAGHRDGFFRGLQSVAPGDVIEVVRPQHKDTYVISSTRIVVPEDVSVLHETAEPTLTLVTCFPFYFVGSAPKRYIVTSGLENAHKFELGTDEDSVLTAKTK
jgi:sortase A